MLLRNVLEVFFMGQIIVEKLDEEVREKIKTISNQFNIEINNGKKTEQWKAIDNAADTVKADYEQAYNALQELLHSTGNLACVVTQAGLPLLASTCNSTKETFEKLSVARR